VKKIVRSEAGARETGYESQEERKKEEEIIPLY
jgi:hypothetical protein